MFFKYVLKLKFIYNYGPHISAHCVSHSMGSSIFIWKMIDFLLIKKMIWSRHLFLFHFFKRVNKIRKKTLSVTPYLEKVIWEKSDRVRRSSYLSGRYGIDHPSKSLKRVSTNRMKLTWQLRRENNEYPELSCTYENKKNMHRKLPKWMRMRTWATIQ